MRIILVLFVLCAYTKILANDLNEYSEKLEQQEKEIRWLINKVEILEHNIDKIKNQLHHADSVPEPRSSVQTKDGTTAGPYADVDIFDVSMLDELGSTSDQRVIDTKNLASDKRVYDLALASFKDNKLEIASAGFDGFIKNYPNSPLISNAHFWYGEIFFKRKDFNQAAINYLKCYKISSKGSKASDALLKLALSLSELGKNKEACDILARLETEYPSRTTSSLNKAREAKMKFGCSKFTN